MIAEWIELHSVQLPLHMNRIIKRGALNNKTEALVENESICLLFLKLNCKLELKW